MADYGVPRVSQKDQAITHSIDELLDIITKYFTYQRECQQNRMKYFQMDRNKDTFYQKTIQRLAQVVVCMFPPEHTFFIIVALNVCLYTGYVSKLQATGMRLSSSNRPLYGVGTTTQMQNSLPCEISQEILPRRDLNPQLTGLAYRKPQANHYHFS